MQEEAKRILVVDDDPDYQAAVKQILSGAGYEVIQAQTKEAGLEALRNAGPDLVILDIMMTRTTDGFHFLYEMKADGEQKKPPILSVSCISKATGFEFSPSDEGDYFPVQDYLVKPVAPDELLAHVEALLEGRGAGTQ
ncbi:MAG: response regulator transcription factor [Planctomycetota bacterium]|jgi:DNA-binding response OmpR family regulator